VQLLYTIGAALLVLVQVST